MSDSERAGTRNWNRKARWLAPVAVAGVVAAGVAISTAGPSDATPSLPPRTAAQLLVAIQRSSATALSGEIQESTNLGLPSLPGDQSSASLSPQDFLTGSHTIRVAVDGADKQRVAVLGQLSEADLVHNGRDVWTYVSETNSVSHTVLPAHASDRPESASPNDYTPLQLADRVLKAIDPTTSVAVDTAQRVAGRSAYTLVVRPRDARSTVREVRIAIDAAKFVPLQVQVFGAGSKAAIDAAFTSISFATPAASTFDFTKPAGATVSTDPFGTRDGGGEFHREGHGGTARATRPAAHATTKTIGSGWTTVVEASGGQVAALSSGALRDLTSSVGTSGERLLHTALLNAVLLPDGRAFLGAVTPAALESIAAATPN